MKPCKSKVEHKETKVVMQRKWTKTKKAGKRQTERKVVGSNRTQANPSLLVTGDGEQQLPSPSFAIILKNWNYVAIL